MSATRSSRFSIPGSEAQKGSDLVEKTMHDKGQGAFTLVARADRGSSRDPAFGESSMAIYAAVHAALRGALAANGHAAELATVAALHERRSQINSAVTDRR